MNARKIYNLLNSHPYFAKLSEADKLNVMNLALNNYRDLTEEELHYGVYPNGSKGWDGEIINNPVPYELSQSLLSLSSLSDFKVSEVDLSNNNYLPDISEEDRFLIYTIAVQKITRQIPDRYLVQNSEGSVAYLEEVSFTKPIVDYANVGFISVTDTLRFDTPVVTYRAINQEVEELFFGKPIVSYELLIKNTFDSDSLIPRDFNNPYLESVKVDKPIVSSIVNNLVSFQTLSLNAPVVAYETVSVNYIEELTFSKPRIESIVWASGEANLNKTYEDTLEFSKPRIVYQKY